MNFSSGSRSLQKPPDDPLTEDPSDTLVVNSSQCPPQLNTGTSGELEGQQESGEVIVLDHPYPICNISSAVAQVEPERPISLLIPKMLEHVYNSLVIDRYAVPQVGYRTESWLSVPKQLGINISEKDLILAELKTCVKYISLGLITPENINNTTFCMSLNFYNGSEHFSHAFCASKTFQNVLGYPPERMFENFEFWLVGPSEADQENAKLMIFDNPRLLVTKYNYTNIVNDRLFTRWKRSDGSSSLVRITYDLSETLNFRVGETRVFAFCGFTQRIH